MFEDRRDAGKQLAQELEAYRDEGVLVLAIPRGGVEVGYQVAKHLDADLSLLIVRKLPYPDQPEAGFGALAEDGSTVILRDATRWLSEETINRVIDEQRREIERRLAVLRRGEPLPDLTGRTVILVDDGIGMKTRRRLSSLSRSRVARLRSGSEASGMGWPMRLWCWSSPGFSGPWPRCTSAGTTCPIARLPA